MRRLHGSSHAPTNDAPAGDHIGDAPAGDPLGDAPTGDRSGDAPTGDRSGDAPTGDRIDGSTKAFVAWIAESELRRRPFG